jgi:tetratricopeptide (TPR) repeat protein
MKNFVSLFSIVLFLSISLFAQGQMDPEAGKLFNEGNQNYKSGNYEGALASYNNALKTSSDYRIFYQKGVTLLKLRKYNEAEEAINKCIEAKPDYVTGYKGLGVAYYASGKYDKAVEAYKKYGELSTKAKDKKAANEYVARAYTKLGEAAKADGKQQQAIEYFNQAVASSPFDAAYLLLAEVYVDNQMYDKALEAADKALNYRQKIPKGGPLYFKGKAFLGKGEIEKAKEAFNAGKKDKNYKDLCEYELKAMNR